MKKEKKTNAMRILDIKGISYLEHTYGAEDGLIDGISVAEKCNADPKKVYKTLVSLGSDKNHYVFVIPVEKKLDLKLAAKVIQVKSIVMIPQKELLPLTGYIHGGCSPVGMKKSFPIVFDDSVLRHDTIYVSGGKIGLQIEINPTDLIRVVDGTTAKIIKD